MAPGIGTRDYVNEEPALIGDATETSLWRVPEVGDVVASACGSTVLYRSTDVVLDVRVLHSTGPVGAARTIGRDAGNQGPCSSEIRLGYEAQLSEKEQLTRRSWPDRVTASGQNEPVYRRVRRGCNGPSCATRPTQVRFNQYFPGPTSPASFELSGDRS